MPSSYDRRPIRRKQPRRDPKKNWPKSKKKKKPDDEVDIVLPEDLLVIST